MASTTFDLPEPLGPTTTVTPGSSSSVVASANDLKPLRVNVLRNMAPPKLSGAVSAARDGRQAVCVGTRRRRRVLARRGSEPLADRAPVVAAPGGHPASDDPPTAGAATLAGAAVHAVVELVGARPTHQVDVLGVAQRRPTATHGRSEHVEDLLVQPAHRRAASAWRRRGRGGAAPRGGSRRSRCCRCRRSRAGRGAAP